MRKHKQWRCGGASNACFHYSQHVSMPMPFCRSQLLVPCPPPSAMPAGAFDDLSDGVRSDGALGDLSDAEGAAANVPSAPGTPSGVLPRAGEAARAGSRMPTNPTPSSFLPEAAEGRPAGFNAASRVVPWARAHASGGSTDVQMPSTAGGVEDVLLVLSEDGDATRGTTQGAALGDRAAGSTNQGSAPCLS